MTLLHNIDQLEHFSWKYPFWPLWPLHDLWGQTVDNFCSHLLTAWTSENSLMSMLTGHSDQVWSKSDQACGRRNKLWEEEQKERGRAKKPQERNKLGETYFTKVTLTFYIQNRVAKYFPKSLTPQHQRSCIFFFWKRAKDFSKILCYFLKTLVHCKWLRCRIWSPILNRVSISWGPGLPDPPYLSIWTL